MSGWGFLNTRMGNNMGDEDYTDDSDSGGSVMQTGAAPMAILAGLGNQYTSQEAHDLARNAYSSLNAERSDLTQDEDSLASDMQAAADDAKAQLKAARDRLIAKKFDQSEKWLALAEGLGKPTTSGSFGETIGNVAHNMLGVNADRGKFEDQQEAGVTQFGQNISAIDRTLLQSKMAMDKARREANTKLLQENMRTLGREVRPGAGASGHGPPSKNGKIAFDENLVPGSPEFIRRVQELNAIDRKNAAAVAGTDAPVTGNEDATMAAEDQAHSFGVPLAPAALDPYRGMSTNERKAARGIEQKDMEKRLGTLQQTQTDAQQGIADMNRFLQLNRKVDTGFIPGLFPGLSDPAQQMDAITAAASRKMRQPGEGSTSDFDAKMFMKATVSRSKNYQANLGIATAYKVMRKNELDHIAFLQDYAALNGHMRGADAAWRSYLESNPIFDKSKPDTFTLNKNRKDYRTFFRENMGQKL